MQAMGFALLALLVAGAVTADQAVILTARQLDMITAGDVVAIAEAGALGVGDNGALAVTDTDTLASSSDSYQYGYANADGLAVGDKYAGTITEGFVGMDGAAVGAYTGAEAKDGGVAGSTLTLQTKPKNKNITYITATGEAVAIGSDPVTSADAYYIAPEDAKFKEKVKTKTIDGISTTTLDASLKLKNNNK
jgi:hypothetical protein